VVYREVCTEGSGTAKSGTDEQKRNMRHHCSGEQPLHCNAQRIQKDNDVDFAGIGGKKSTYRGRSWSRFVLQAKKSAEVIVTKETSCNKKYRGLTKAAKD